MKTKIEQIIEQKTEWLPGEFGCEIPNFGPAAAEIAKIWDEPMSCGHARRYIVSSGEGTNWCALCELESYQATVEELTIDIEGGRLPDVLEAREEVKQGKGIPWKEARKALDRARAR